VLCHGCRCQAHEFGGTHSLSGQGRTAASHSICKERNRRLRQVEAFNRLRYIAFHHLERDEVHLWKHTPRVRGNTRPVSGPFRSRHAPNYAPPVLWLSNPATTRTERAGIVPNRTVVKPRYRPAAQHTDMTQSNRVRAQTHSHFLYRRAHTHTHTHTQGRERGQCNPKQLVLS
jgi:hypothetical protein